MRLIRMNSYTIFKINVNDDNYVFCLAYRGQKKNTFFSVPGKNLTISKFPKSR